MADKIISIKLNVDTSDSSKLATITTEYAKELTKVEQRAKDIALIERARVFEIKRQQEAYAEVAGSVAIANALIKKDSPFAQLGIQLAERQLKEYNIALADTAAKLRNISAIQAETRTYSLNIPKDNPIANTNPNAPDNLRPVEQAGKVGESYGASQQRQEELNKARLTRELIQRQDFNTATEAIEKEAATRRNFIAQSEANSRAIMYAGLFDQLEAKQQAHNARTIMYEELFAQQERDIAARKTAQGGYAAQRQQEETNKAANIRNAELASLRTSIEEQHALRMSSFNSSLREQEAQLRSSIAIRNSEEIHGINSIQAARLRAVEQNRLSEATRQNSISNITSAVNRSALTQVQGVTAATNANAAYAASIHTNNAALQHLETAHQQSLNTQRNLIVRAAEFIGIYQVLNYTLSTVSQSIRAIPKIGIELDSTNASLLATIGSASGAASVLQALNMEAERTGINIGTLRETFRSFQASTSLAGATLESTWHMFTNLNTVITGLHLTADKANGIFLAMAQIFNKGKVQSEELVKQLGNLLPGAFASFAASMDISGKELSRQMKLGLVTAKDTVENFTTFMADRFQVSFGAASQGLNANIGRMQTSLTHLAETIYEKVSPSLLVTTKNITSFTDGLTNAIKKVSEYTELLSVLGNILEATVAVGVGALLAKLIPLSTIVGTITAGLSLLAAPVGFAAAVGATIVSIGLITKALIQNKEAIEEQRRSFRAMLHEAAEPAKIAGPQEQIKIDVQNSPAIRAAREQLELTEKKLSQLQAEVNSPKNNVTKNQREAFINDNKASYDQLQQELLTKKQFLNKVTEIETENNETSKKLAVNALEEFEVNEKIKLKAHIDSLANSTKAEEAALGARLRHQQQFEKEISAMRKIADAEAILPSVVPAGKYHDEEYKTLLDAQVEQKREANATLAEFQAGENKAAITALEEVETKKSNLNNKVVTDRLKTIKQESEAVLAGIAQEKAAYQTRVTIADLQHKPIGQEEVNAKLNSLELRMIAVKRSAALEIIQLQEQSLHKQTTSVEKALQVIQNIESSGNKRAVSPTGALGLMQVQPSTLKSPGLGLQGIDVPQNILNLELKAKQLNKVHEQLNAVDKKAMSDYAANNSEVFAEFGKNYYTKLVQYFKGDLVRAAAAYNAGYSNESKNIRPKETIDYVAKFSKGIVSDSLEERRLSVSEKIQAAVAEEAKVEKETADIRNNAQIAALTLDQQRIDSLREIHIAALKVNGNTGEADRLSIENKYLIANNKLIAEQGNAKAQIGITENNLLKQHELSLAAVADIEKKTQLSASIFASEELRVQAEILSGMTSQHEGAVQLRNAKSDYIVALLAESKLIEEQLRFNSKDVDLQLKKLEIQQKLSSLTRSSGTARSLDLESQGAFGQAMQTDTTNQNNILEDRANDINKASDKSYTPLNQVERQKAIAEEIQTINEKADKAMLLSKVNMYTAMAKQGADFAKNSYDASVQLFGKQSGLAKAAYMVYKAFKTAEIIGDTAKAAIGAYSATVAIPYVGPVLAPIAAGVAIAFGAAQLALLVSTPAAHGGLTEVPAEQTYLLQKGERVLSPNQNKDLNNYMKRTTNNNSSGGTVAIGNVNVTVQAKEGETSDAQAEAIGKAIRVQLKGMMQSELVTAQRPGGSLNPTQLSSVF